MKFLCRGWTFKVGCPLFETDKTVLNKVFDADDIERAIDLALNWIRECRRENTRLGYTLCAILEAIEPDFGVIGYVSLSNFPNLPAADNEQLLLKGGVSGNQSTEKSLTASGSLPLRKGEESDKEKEIEQIRKLLKPITFSVSVEGDIYNFLKLLSNVEKKPIHQIIQESLGLYLEAKGKEIDEESMKLMRRALELKKTS